MRLSGKAVVLVAALLLGGVSARAQFGGAGGATAGHDHSDSAHGGDSLAPRTIDMAAGTTDYFRGQTYYPPGSTVTATGSANFEVRIASWDATGVSGPGVSTAPWTVFEDSTPYKLCWDVYHSSESSLGLTVNGDVGTNYTNNGYRDTGGTHNGWTETATARSIYLTSPYAGFGAPAGSGTHGCVTFYPEPGGNRIMFETNARQRTTEAASYREQVRNDGEYLAISKMSQITSLAIKSQTTAAYAMTGIPSQLMPVRGHFELWKIGAAHP